METKTKGKKKYFVKTEIKAGVAVLIQDKTDLKTKAISKDNEGSNNSTSEYPKKLKPLD